MASKQIIEIVQKITYSFIVDGVGKPLSSEEAIELIKAQGFIKTELDSGAPIPVKETLFSYKPNTAIFYNGRNLGLTPQLSKILTLLFEKYNRGENCATTTELVEFLTKFGYKDVRNDIIYARIGDLNQRLTTLTGKKVICNDGRGYYYLDFPANS